MHMLAGHVRGTVALYPPDTVPIGVAYVTPSGVLGHHGIVSLDTLPLM